VGKINKTSFYTLVFIPKTRLEIAYLLFGNKPYENGVKNKEKNTPKTTVFKITWIN
jgi:hypothetical protein